MGSIAVAAGLVSVAVVLIATPSWAQLSNEPYSYRSGGGTGMSDAYRQAMMDREITGSRPRNLLRGADGSLLTVEERDGQAVVTTRSSNYVFYRGGNVAGVGVAGAGFGTGAAIDGWVAQLDGLRPLE